MNEDQRKEVIELLVGFVRRACEKEADIAEVAVLPSIANILIFGGGSNTPRKIAIPKDVISFEPVASLYDSSSLHRTNKRVDRAEDRLSALELALKDGKVALDEI